MKYLFTSILILISISTLEAQESKKDSWFSLQISYGPQYNNFVDYGQEIRLRDETIIPIEGLPGEATLFQKREIGTYFNATVNLRLGGRNYLEIGHSRTMNQGLYNGVIGFPNGTEVIVEDFQLRHRNHFYKLGYKRSFFKDKIFVSIGLAHTTFQQSEISINPNTSNVLISERNNDNSNLSELTSYLGLQYDFYQSGRFILGVQSTAYIIISAGTELETFAIAPTLKYQF